jgi:hypothetical protein
MTNLRILSREELRALEDFYQFEIVGDNLLVKSPRFQSGFAHSMKEDFSLNAVKFKTKIKFNISTINMWSKYFKEKHSLFAVQNAVNILRVLHQSETVNNVKSILERDSLYIQII